MDQTVQNYVIISFFDISYFFLVIASYIADVFQYMNKFYISIFQITFTYHENGLITRVPGFYIDFHNYFCVTRSNIEFKQICDNYSSFYSAAIVYLSLTLVCMVLNIYGIIEFISESLNWRRSWLKQRLCHYVYPILHTIAVLAYVWVSGFYSLSPPDGFDGDFDVWPYAGIFLMMFAELCCVIGLFIYLFMEKDPKSLQSGPDESDYKPIQDIPFGNLQQLPVLPVSETFKSESSDEASESEESLKEGI
jgi:hypothetical protein